MAKYDSYAKWFTARCAQIEMSYEEFQPLAKRVLGIDVPRSTYEMQRSYLKRRTPEEMGDLPTTSMGKLR